MTPSSGADHPARAVFAVPWIVALLCFIYARPQEIVEALAAVPFLYVFLGLAMLGLVVDLRTGQSKPLATPHLKLAIPFYVWCLLTHAVRSPSTLVAAAVQLSVALTLFFLVGHAVQSFKGFQVVAATTLAMALFVAVVGVHQGSSDFGCVMFRSDAEKNEGRPDGRPCQTAADCERSADSEPGAQYLCEKIGLFGTSSVGRGRVRYRGVLQDPNEVALATSITIPFVLALRIRRPTFGRTLLVVVAMALVGTCVVMTGSRGGILVYLAAVGAYFVRRYGVRGLVAGGALGLPLLLLGGRSGQEADASSLERLECLAEGFKMFRQYPVLGVGFDRFLEFHFLTAHNSYVLALSELGPIGSLLWASLLYVSFKTPITVLRRYAGDPEATVATTWAMALVAAFSGMLIGIFFLSMTYHYVLWIFFGLAAALYAAVKRHDPTFEVRFGLGDLALVALADFGLLALIAAYVRVKLGHF